MAPSADVPTYEEPFMYAITGASGQLGRLVVQQLIARGVAASQIVALVRQPAKAADLAAQGVVIREADYSRPATLGPALAGVQRLLLVSSSELGQRLTQHQAVIAAAQAAGVGFVAYTSLLHADTSPLGLGVEHRATEDTLRASGLPYAVLRNGWYTENYLASVPPALQHGAFIGSAGEGRIASATRLDYAEAAAVVLLAIGGGALCGWFNGWVSMRWSLPTFIVTSTSAVRSRAGARSDRARGRDRRSHHHAGPQPGPPARRRRRAG